MPGSSRTDRTTASRLRRLRCAVHLNQILRTRILLAHQDVGLFSRLHRTLMFFVNQRCKVIPDNVIAPDEFAALSPKVWVQVRDALNANLDLVETFVDVGHDRASKSAKGQASSEAGVEGGGTTPMPGTICIHNHAWLRRSQVQIPKL